MHLTAPFLMLLYDCTGKSVEYHSSRMQIDAWKFHANHERRIYAFHVTCWDYTSPLAYCVTNTLCAPDLLSSVSAPTQGAPHVGAGHDSTRAEREGRSTDTAPRRLSRASSQPPLSSVSSLRTPFCFPSHIALPRHVFTESLLRPLLRARRRTALPHCLHCLSHLSICPLGKNTTRCRRARRLGR